jgi:hypothetical protein
MLQVIIVLAAGAMAIAGVLVLKSYVDDDQPAMLLLAVLFSILFIWLFGMALRLPTSFVAISQDRIRIRFGGFADQTFETTEVAGAKLVNWPLWKGLGARTALSGDVALVAAWGPAVEVTLKRPLRVWLIPRLWRTSATRVTLSVRNPQKMVERFGPVPSATGKAQAKPNRRKGATR